VRRRLYWGWLSPRGRGLGERHLHSIEHQEGGGMPCLVVLDGLKHGEVRPATRGRRPTRLQHGSHGLADLAELFGVGTYDVAAHDGGGSLSQEASLDRLPKRRHAIAFDLE